MARVNLVVILGVFVFLSFFSFFQANSSSVISESNEKSNQHVKVQPAGSARGRFKPTELFSFDRFKKIFKRVYSSILEEMARKRLYLARAMQVFSSAVKYKYSLRTSYLAINRMSDWTPLEIKRLYSDGSKIFKRQEMLGTAKIRHQDGVNKFNQEILQDLPERIEDHKGSSESQRMKRDTNEKQDLELDELFKEPITTRHSIIGDKIASNNPQYSAPKVSSEDDASSGLMNSMPSNLAKRIISLPVVSFATDILGSTWNKYVAKYFEKDASNQCQSPLCDRSESNTISASHSNETITEPRNLPDEVYIDHRKSNCFTPIKSQDDCGSCYIFATIAMYEWLLCNQTENRVNLSEQYIIDCGNGTFDLMSGCESGNILMVPGFVRHFGLELQENYPYKAKTNQCPYKPDEIPSNIEKMGYLKLNGQNNYTPVSIEIVPEILFERPITMNIPVSDEFIMYGGGVDEPTNCVYTMYHSMLLVASGREDGLEYFVFRNSHGVDWGEEGYYKVIKKSPCFPKYTYTLMADFKPELSGSMNEKYNAITNFEQQQQQLKEVQSDNLIQQ